MKQVKRTRAMIQREIKETEAQRERFAALARSEPDKDYKAGLYGNVDICNERINRLVAEREKVGR